MNKKIMLGLALIGFIFGGSVKADWTLHGGYWFEDYESGNAKHLASTRDILRDDCQVLGSAAFFSIPLGLVGAAITKSAYGLALGAVLGGWCGFSFGDWGLRESGRPAGNPLKLFKRIRNYPKHRNCTTTEVCKALS